jgi:hypothetical protein
MSQATTFALLDLRLSCAGNSGGVLLNSRGAVIGVNLGILDPSGKGSFSGVGFAIPIDTVRGLVDQILAHGRVRRPSLGITIAPEQVRAAMFSNVSPIFGCSTWLLGCALLVKSLMARAPSVVWVLPFPSTPCGGWLIRFWHMDA